MNLMAIWITEVKNKNILHKDQAHKLIAKNRP